MTKLAKVIVVVFLTAGIAHLGLLAGTPTKGAKARKEVDRMRGHYPAPMPHYPGAKELPLGQSLKVGGSGMKMSYFQTPDEPLRIASFYAAQWNAAGHHVTEDITPKGGVVGAYDPGKGILRQVLIKRRGRSSTVFPSLMMQPMRPTTGTTTGATDVPLYPGAEGVLSFGARDPGHQSRVTMYTNYGGLVNNVEFFRSRLPEQGWTEVTTRVASLLPKEFQRTMTFHKGSRELTLNVTQVDTEGRVRVHVTEATGVELGYPGKPPAGQKARRAPGAPR